MRNICLNYHNMHISRGVADGVRTPGPCAFENQGTTLTCDVSVSWNEPTSNGPRPPPPIVAISRTPPRVDVSSIAIAPPRPSSAARSTCAREPTRVIIEPFSGVELHMEIDMEWKWGTICENRMDWIGSGAVST